MYEKFRKAFEEFPVIALADIRMSFPDFDNKNLVNWQNKGYIIKLRNGYYIFADSRRTEYTLFQIANKLYEPSYVSLESALSHYGVIPEGVYSVQSISTRKTSSFNSPVGTFHYYTIKNTLYFGYRLVKEGSIHPFRMASLEKALLDFLYLRPDIDNPASLEALRWNRKELALLNNSTLEEYLDIFQSPTLHKKMKWLYTYLNA